MGGAGAAQLFRKSIASQVSRVSSCTESHVLSLLSTPKPTLSRQFSLPLPKLVPNLQPDQWEHVANKFETTDHIRKVGVQGPFLHFDVQPTAYIRETLDHVYLRGKDYGKQQLHGTQQQTVVIDYSSPNIAKPFHAGHLRSTILGNFVKRIHEAMGYRAIGINYLGDWGKQYGLLAVGFEKYGSQQELERDPIHHLYQVYVRVNQDNDPGTDRLANEYFRRMEQGDKHVLEQWKRFRDLSVKSYASVYRRLGITFERYSGESETEPYIQSVYDLLQKHKLVKTEPDGAWSVDLSEYGLGTAVVRRGDGTSLYVTRDLASLLLRQEQYHPHKLVYVVGTEQSLYLQQLFKIAELVLPQQYQSLHHAGFGRVQGMSTRKGTVVFLQDILDTAQEKMLENMKQGQQKFEELMDQGIVDDEQGRLLSGNEAVDYVADQLGMSAVMIQDMVAKRVKNYTFSYDRMTAARGYTGVFLQFTHARMCGIERRAQVPITPDCNVELLQEKEAFELALTISQYPDIVESSYNAMEPCTIVQYLFKLAHTTSQAIATLRVKDVDPELAKARMLLFWAAKTTLANGLELLGIRPLERM